MFLIGMLAILQIIFLPGFIVLCLLRYPNNIIKYLLLSFTLSQLINYIVIFTLAAFGWYLPPVIWIIIMIEILIVILLKLRDKQNRKEQMNFFWTLFSTILIIILFAWLANQYIFRSGSIFWGADELMSWNKWALLWSGNHLPGGNNNAYAQLIPINWSLIYVLINSREIGFFAKTIMPLYPLFIIFSGLLIFLEEKKLSFLAGLITLIITIGAAWKHFPSITMGFVDIPVACMVFASFAILYSSRNIRNRSELLINIFLSSLIAVASAVTKQPGLIYAAVFPFLMLILYRSNALIKLSEKRNLFLIYIFLVISVASSWYIYNEYLLFHQGLKKITSQIAAFNYMNGLSILGRFKAAIPILEGNLFGLIGVILYFFFSLWSAYRSEYKWPLIIIQYPFILLWIIFASYEFRNFAIAVPFLGLSLGLGVSGFFAWLSKFAPKTMLDVFQKKYRIALEFIDRYIIKIKDMILPVKRFASLITLTLIIFFIGISFYFTSAYLHAEQMKRNWEYIGDFRTMNQVLHESYLKDKIHGVILSDYEFLPYLPGVQSDVLGGMRFDQMTNILKKKSYHYVLYFYENIATNNSAVQWLKSGTNNHTLNVLFQTNEWIFIESLK